MPWGLKPFQQSGQTNSVTVEQLPASHDRGRRFGGNRVGVDGAQARADGTDAASQESTTPLKPTEGLSGPPAVVEVHQFTRIRHKYLRAEPIYETRSRSIHGASSEH